LKITKLFGKGNSQLDKKAENFNKWTIDYLPWSKFLRIPQRILLTFDRSLVHLLKRNYCP